jgi:hypothetical protein
MTAVWDAGSPHVLLTRTLQSAAAEEGIYAAGALYAEDGAA